MEQNTQQQETKNSWPISYWIDKIQPESLRERVKELRNASTFSSPESAEFHNNWSCFDFDWSITTEGYDYWQKVYAFCQVFDGNVGDLSIQPVRYATDTSKMESEIFDLKAKVANVDRANDQLLEQINKLHNDSNIVVQENERLQQLVSTGTINTQSPVTLHKSFRRTDKAARKMEMGIDGAKMMSFIVTNKGRRGDGKITPIREIFELYLSSGEKVMDNDYSYLSYEEVMSLLQNIQVDGNSLFTAYQVADLLKQVYK